MTGNAYIIDTTLRDGEQAPGVAFSITDKLAVASFLHDMGVDEVEAGTPAIGRDEQEAIRLIASYGFAFSTSCWCRANANDISEAATLGTDSINISLPASDIQISALNKNRAWILRQMKEAIKQAADSFSHVTMGAQDASRADMDFLKEFIFYATEEGANRIRISDTVGIFDPFETHALFKELLKHFPGVEFEFHGHNDLGMATANAIGALNGGAQCISATVNGLGERAGNSALEEVVAILQEKYGITRFNTGVIHNLSHLVSRLSNRPLPSDKPLLGEKVYTHESGIHTSALLKDSKTYQFLSPEKYGAGRMQFSFGKHSGSGAVKDYFARLGIYPEPNQINTLLQFIKKHAVDQRRNVYEGELLQFWLNEVPVNPSHDKVRYH